jgi:hypothetical protein
MYAPAQQRGGEDHLDSPLSSLGLIEHQEPDTYSSVRTTRPFLPPIVMHIALQQRFTAQSSHENALPIRELLYGGSGIAAPAAIFRLSEEGLMTSLHTVLEQYPRQYELRETAGLHQLYRLTPLQPIATLLKHYYQGLGV